jgi:hypothetical protein
MQKGRILAKVYGGCEWGDENIMEITFKPKIVLIPIKEVT